MTAISRLIGTSVSRETHKRLELYAALTRKWNRKINLVSNSTLDHIETRHIMDSAQLWPLKPSGAASWLDIGSGAGFPGMVIAILADELAPEIRVAFVESDQRKCAFLATVAREVKISVEIHRARAEVLEPQFADVVSARALAPLRDLLTYASRHLAAGGIGIFPKGASAEDEVVEALESWRFHCDSYSSKTDEDAVILKIGDIERV